MEYHLHQPEGQSATGCNARLGGRGWQLMAAVAGLLVVGCQVAILQQQFAMQTMVQQRHPIATLTHDAFDASVPMPHKLLLSGLTPTADQGMRADCWLFSVVGVLEDSYRRFGVANGWLAPDRFLRLSRQAFGVRVMELCKQRPNLLCPAVLAPDGRTILWGNTSEWGDLTLLRILHELSDAAVPDSTCPYTPAPDAQQGSCPGLAAASATNPLRFAVKSSWDLFEVQDVKQALMRDQRVLALGAPMLSLPYYLPCTTATATAYSCDPTDEARCVACPLERAFANVGCCIEANRSMVTMKGEWHHQPSEKVIESGGHAVNIVGFNDAYRDEAGNVGGFIIRNSWSDGLGLQHGAKGRGSHSAAYYHQSVSEQEEALACANPHSPRSWQKCADVTACRSPLLALQARAARKPLRLRCLDDGAWVTPGLCERERGATYYLKNLTEYGGGLFVGCVVVDGPPPTTTTTAGDAAAAARPTELCAPPLLIDDLATIFTPVDAELTPYLNEPTLCGYNFLPYATFELIQARVGGLFATDFDISWSEESYPPRDASTKRALDRRRYDYGRVEANTRPLPRRNVSKPVWI